MVVEGVGDHGCEYMTGGRAVVLGATGRNFAAGMSGGIAYVVDLDRDNVNTGNLGAVEPLDDTDKQWLHDVVRRHHEETGSTVAEKLLADWDAAVARFSKIIPPPTRQCSPPRTPPSSPVSPRRRPPRR